MLLRVSGDPNAAQREYHVLTRFSACECQAAVKIETAARLIITSLKKKPNQGQQTTVEREGDVVTRVTPPRAFTRVTLSQDVQGEHMFDSSDD